MAVLFRATISTEEGILNYADVLAEEAKGFHRITLKSKKMWEGLKLDRE